MFASVRKMVGSRCEGLRTLYGCGSFVTSESSF